MKVAPTTKAPVGMALLGIAFVLVMALALVWPKSPGNTTKGYTEDGTAVQSDTISPQTAAKDDSTR
jgi:hypothetical protein